MGPDAPWYRNYESKGTDRADPYKPAERVRAEEERFRMLAQACEAGDVRACSDQGEAYETGAGAPQVRPVAAILYSEACATGDATACFRRGRLNLIGKDEFAKTEAVRDFDLACSMGSAEGCVAFADELARGEGIEEDRNRAVTLMRQNCDNGAQPACGKLARFMLEDSDDPTVFAQAVALLDGACDTFDRPSCDKLLDLQGESDDTPGLPLRAKVVYNACSAGSGFRCTQLADMAFVGDGVVQDREYAMQVYDRACALETVSCHIRDTMLKVPQLSEECSAGDPRACGELGQIYFVSTTVYRDDRAASGLFAYACRNGETEYCFNAAMTAEHLGDDVAAAEAEFLEASCDSGGGSACEMLGDRLWNFNEESENRERAFEYYAKACAADHDRVCEQMGRALKKSPDLPLALAGSGYLPPADPESGEDPLAERLAERRAEAGDACTSSTVNFRGREYSDTVCEPQDRVINGRALRPGAAPWQALIWRPLRLRGTNRDLPASARVLCGGSVISRGWILTAAHCLTDQGASVVGRGYRIRLGVHNPRNDEGISYPIIEAFVHPDYDRSDYAFDIALVRYDHTRGISAATTNSIGSISVDHEPVEERRIYKGMPVYTYGWGWTDAVRSTSTTELLSARLETTTLDRCTEITGFDETSGRNGKSELHAALCAAGRNGEQSCKGDSGGPLIYYRDADRRPRVIGVISSGRACGADNPDGSAGEESRYTRVGLVYPWIRRVMNSRR